MHDIATMIPSSNFLPWTEFYIGKIGAAQNRILQNIPFFRGNLPRDLVLWNCVSKKNETDVGCL